MKCQHCGNNEATVHLVEMADGKRRDLWLCTECAEAEQWRRLDYAGRDPGAADAEPGSSAHGGFDETFDSMLDFLGRLSLEAEEGGNEKPCPHCGATWRDFQESGQLGCARCYTVFRSRLLPLLESFHRHAAHMGRSPHSRSGGGSNLVEISRLRVVLEKAIAAEEFEEAARLRDQLHLMERRPDPEDPHG